uniref:Uncharacterized protein n=1 Tax=Leersia perrieri TaxID=77586 RepID=A0A0D9XB98_9ORYZ
MARLPSPAIFSFVCSISVPVMGFSLLATQTVVKTGILLNHMPRYQLGEVMLSDLLVFGWKKPSANFPFLEMSLSPTVSACAPVRVSFVAEHQGLPMEKRRRLRNM